MNKIFLKSINVMFGIHCEKFTTIKLINRFTTSHSYHFLVFMERKILKIYSHSNFQGHNTVTILYIRSLKLIHLITRSLYPLNNIFASTSLTFLDSTYKRDHTVFVFLWLAHSAQHTVLQVRPCCWEWQDFLLSYGWIIFLVYALYIEITHRCWHLVFPHIITINS